jgi:hypothetical protein
MQFVAICYGNITRKLTSIFFIYRYNSRFLRVRAGSEFFNGGGTVHNVIGGFYHGLFNISKADYDVAILKVCIDFDIPIDSANCVTCLL